MKRLDDVFGEANLPSWCVIVLRHGGHVTGAFTVFCPQKCRRRQKSSLPQTCFFQCLAGGDPVYIQSTLWDNFSFSLWLSSAGVAPLPPCSHKLLDETVKTFTVFPRGCIFSMVKTIVCCLCHLVRVTFTIAVGKVTKIARCCPPELSRCCATHFGSL